MKILVISHKSPLYGATPSLISMKHTCVHRLAVQSDYSDYLGSLSSNLSICWDSMLSSPRCRLVTDTSIIKMYAGGLGSFCSYNNKYITCYSKCKYVYYLPSTLSLICDWLSNNIASLVRTYVQANFDWGCEGYSCYCTTICTINTNFAIIFGGHIFNWSKQQLWSLHNVSPPSLMVQVTKELLRNYK